jgi:hypothetical protein
MSQLNWIDYFKKIERDQLLKECFALLIELQEIE